MSSAVIDLQDLTIIRGGRAILSVEQLRVGEGEVVALLGPNGAGKSTLLKSCVGLVRVRQGRVNVLGQSLSMLSRSAVTRLRRRVAYLPQVLAPSSEMPLTAREVVAVGRTGRVGLFRRLQRCDWQIVDQWLDKLGLTALSRVPYGVLSGGEQRKVLLAMVMSQQPEILLLDEPTANLDVRWREQIVATLDTLHTAGGLTLVLVCHDLEALPRATQRVVVLRAGRVMMDGRPEDVLAPDCITTLYGPGLTVIRRGDRYLLAPEATVRAG